MSIKARENKVSAWIFLVGVILAIVGGVIFSFGFTINPIILTTLTLMGLVAGFFVDVEGEAGNRFLVLAVSLVIVSFAGQQAILKFNAVNIGKIIASTLASLLVLLVPATIIVVIKSLFGLATR